MPKSSKRILATIMFTDMVGYTALMQEDEALARKKRKRHKEVFDQLHEKYQGQVVQYFGDGTLSIFQNALDAVHCAIDLQLGLKEPIEVPLRIGLHLGEVVWEEDQLVGDAVNVASRVESFAATGSILVSEEVAKLLKNQKQLSFQSMGEFQFKNVMQAKELFAIRHEGLVMPTPNELAGKGKRSEGFTDNLPKVLTSFIGREKEISELQSLLKNHRLITLTGPGGSGKTRLSIQTAREVQDQFKDGIFWVPLASVLDHEVVAFSIAKHLGLKEDALLEIDEVLVRFFKNKQALLILDNFEQILGAAGIVEQLLHSCPDLKVLVSSRIILQIPGEEEYPVPPLNLPSLNGSVTLERLEKVPSIALFAQRAASTRKKFRLTEENIKAVAEICIRLDGLPLAIELAAARIKIFKPRALLERLNKSLDILKGGGKLPERHQTLRQTIAWSYDLLEAEEQELFRRTAVFVGGGTLEAIESICGQNGLADWDVVDGVMALVDKSLLQTDDTEEDTRFFMLETIREFAVDSLREAPNVREQKKAHIDYFLELAEEAGKHLRRQDSEYWVNILLQEQANFRAAINYSVEIKELGLAYRLILALRLFWLISTRITEAIQLIEQVLDIPTPEQLLTERQKILQGLAQIYLTIPLPRKAVPILEENLAFWRKHGDQRQVGLALNDLGWGYAWTFDLADYVKLSLEAKAIFDSLDDQEASVASLNNLMSAYSIQRKPQKVFPLIEEAIYTTTKLGDQRRYAVVLLWQGYSYLFSGNYQKAEGLFKESLSILQGNIHRLYRSWCYGLFSLLNYAKGEFEQSALYNQQLEQLNRQTGTKWGLIMAYQTKALIFCAQKEYEKALIWGEKSEKIRDSIDSETVGIRNASVLARIAIALKNLDRARHYTQKLIANEIENESYGGFLPGLETAAQIAALEGDYEQAAILYFNTQRLRAELGTPVFRSEEHIYEALFQKLKDNLSEKSLKLAQQPLSDKELFNLTKQITQKPT